MRMIPMVYWKKFDAVVPDLPYPCIHVSQQKGKEISTKGSINEEGIKFKDAQL